MCDVCSFILNNFQVNITYDYINNSEFHQWIYHSCKKCLIILIQKLGNFAYKQKNKNNNSPLHLAVKENKFYSIRLLLELCDFDLFEKGEENKNILEIAIQYCDIVIN